MPYLELKNVSKGFGVNGSRAEVLRDIAEAVVASERRARETGHGRGATRAADLGQLDEEHVAGRNAGRVAVRSRPRRSEPGVEWLPVDVAACLVWALIFGRSFSWH